MTRSRAEAWLAVLFTAAMLLVGGAVLFFIFTISPVHTDPAAVPSTAAAQAERYSSALDGKSSLTGQLLCARTPHFVERDLATNSYNSSD